MSIANSLLNKYLNRLSIILALIFGLASVGYFANREYRECLGRLDYVSHAVSHHFGSQGLVVGSTGFASLFTSLVENDGKYSVEALSIRRAGENALDRQFSPSSEFSWSEKVGKRISFTADLAEFRLQCKVDISNSILLWIGLDALGAFLFMWAFLAGISRIYFAQQSLALSELATQVAHDIRAPLVALGGIENLLHELSEDHRIMVRTAVGRIRDIANQLLDRARGRASSDSQPAVHLIWSLVDSIVSEKRMQILVERSDRPVEIFFHPDQNAYSSFTRVSSMELKIILSNLINNAIEAQTSTPERNDVELSIREENDSVQILVIDRGSGIPPELIPELGQKGKTFGRPQGSGLGLYHARTQLTAWGGDLKIKSEVGQGTTMTVVLPKSKPPSWFVDRLEISSGSRVVVLDDDSSIHFMWKQKLSELDAQVQQIDFFRGRDFRVWLQENSINGASLFLFDYELLGESQTGLDIIEEAGLREKAILITSRYEEERVTERCLRLDVKLIPKTLARFVPLQIAHLRPAPSHVGSSEKWDAVLIDDDFVVRLKWKDSAEEYEKKIRIFSSAQEFYEAMSGIAFETPIYIDSQLANEIRGEEESKTIVAKGFKEIYLATGYDPSKFSQEKLSWIRAVVGKTPPWEPIS
jgi:signal transduction histidine kinase